MHETVDLPISRFRAMSTSIAPPLPPRPIPPLPPRPGYPYSALEPGTIRLLHISRGPGTDLVCELQVAHITRLPSYEALSYCWGDPSDKILIDCNRSRGLAITRNLHSALLHLRLPSKPRVVWADAICINQEDTEERNSQVRLMKDIYQHASSVVVWIGGPIEVDGMDIWPIPPFLEAAQKNLKRTELIRHGTKDWVKHILRPDFPTNWEIDDERWMAITKSLILLLHRPWFLRTWIIQEVAFATHATVMCGNHSVSWEDFYRAVSYAIDLDYFSDTVPELYSSMRYIERARRNFPFDQHQRPLDLFASCRIFLATDPRDKVFGLYSLFSPWDLAVLELQPDYSLDPLNVYTQSAIDCITTEGNLDVLSFGGGERSGLVGLKTLPTWVPDWAYQDRKIPLLPRFLSTLSFGEHRWACTWQSATGTSYPVVEISEDKKVLMLSGYVLDRVLETGGVLLKEYYQSQPGHTLREVGSVLQKSGKVLQDWEEICGVFKNTPYRTGEAAWDVYWKTLYAGTYPHGDEQQTKAAFEKWYRPIRYLNSFSDYSEKRIEEIEEKDAGIAYMLAAGIPWFGKSVYKWLKASMGVLSMKISAPVASRMLAFHRSLFKTERGYVGITSRHVKNGDAIALFQGGKVPIILREQQEGKWKIIGDAYIHGIMDGKEFNSSRCSMMGIV